MGEMKAGHVLYGSGTLEHALFFSEKMSCECSSNDLYLHGRGGREDVYFCGALNGKLAGRTDRIAEETYQ